ncbi:hypothetical protein TELCIR_15737 [Teladorsagia circumcincta]|uniref:Uncharacterized protein n=1 Tax=Teladorsagia circumcincta TaxID=45464 RepID=A0A2G9TZ16_TELCI|nr:hypothetical protein TELCIR_15737 [Teladorsagia circumcincta]
MQIEDLAENGGEPPKPKKKEYVDEDLEAPFEVCWEGAPEFQWKPTSAMKLKEEFEGKLGRTIEPTRRMHQLIVKVLPENYELTLEAAKEMFAPLEPVEVENVKDDAE